ncbi:MAG TPA: 1-acyl-sn-glycerol-3-phosphate acyltransferase [Firmicutes bacterium]|nr:1-acyl-sn-glycerol-3-phosphate acyltransferase [Bacillota bacterium]
MLYRICRAILYGWLRLCYGFEVSGAEHLPEKGPVIVVSNHTNLIDPIVVGCSLRQRQVCFMAKEELFRIPLLGGLVRRLGAFPVKRGKGDRGAFRAALGILSADQVLGMFPEGTRHKDGKIHPLRPGAALLAVESGAMILPMVITGTERLKIFRFPRIKAYVGPAFKLAGDNSKKELIRTGTEEIYRHLIALEKKAEIATEKWAKSL